MNKGWKKDLLKNCCKVFDDGNWIESKDQSNDGIRLVQTGNIGFGFFKDKEDKSRFISEETFVKLKCTEILPGDLLVSRLPDPVGKSCIIPDLKIKMITGVDCTIIRTKDYLSPLYLRYYQMSNSYLKDVESRVTGTTRSRISRKNLGLIEIPIPPLEEQQAIVAKLDQAFAQIDQAKANIEKNILNAKELFQSKLNQIFSQKGYGWVEMRVKDIGKVQTGTTPPTSDKDNYGDFIPFIKPAHFNADGSISPLNSYLSEKGIKKSRLIEANSVLMVCIGATIGKTGFTEIDVTCNQQINTITPSKNYNYKFIYFGMISRIFQDDVLENGKGAQATLPIINKSKWENLFLNVNPNKDAQQQIVSQLEQLQEQTNLLVNKYEQKLANLEELKKSILEKAFKGELV